MRRMAVEPEQEIEGQVVSLEKRAQELGRESADAARKLIAWAGSERRARCPDLERMLGRVRMEVHRLEAETGSELGSLDTIDVRLKSLEEQLAQVLAEREEWVEQSLQGRRRRQEDLRALDWLRDEQDRLIAELIRSGHQLQEMSTTPAKARLRRVWKVLRSSGS